MPMNCQEKFDATSFILGGEMHNRTKLQKNKHTNSISTPYLSACVDNKKVTVNRYQYIMIIRCSAYTLVMRRQPVKFNSVMLEQF